MRRVRCIEAPFAGEVPRCRSDGIRCWTSIVILSVVPSVRRKLVLIVKPSPDYFGNGRRPTAGELAEHEPISQQRS